MKFQRELSALVGIPAVLALLFLAPAWAFGCFVALVALATLREFLGLGEAAGIAAPRPLAFLLAAAVLALAVFPPASPSGVAVGGAAFLAAALFAVAVLISRRPLEGSLPSVAVAALGLLLIVLPFCGVVWLARSAFPGAGPRFGPRAILFLLATIWGCDSAAYYVGRTIGRHKLAPVVSPKKTWEGTIGGLLGSVLVAVACANLFLREFSPMEAAVVGAAASSAGQVGDLVESMFKRGAGVKDSGVFLPGHGGFYDRVDSLLFAAPVLCGAILLKMAA